VPSTVCQLEGFDAAVTSPRGSGLPDGRESAESGAAQPLESLGKMDSGYESRHGPGPKLTVHLGGDVADDERLAIDDVERTAVGGCNSA